MGFNVYIGQIFLSRSHVMGADMVAHRLPYVYFLTCLCKKKKKKKKKKPFPMNIE